MLCFEFSIKEGLLQSQIPRVVYESRNQLGTDLGFGIFIIVSFLGLLVALSGILPSVMQDELFYKEAIIADELGASDLPNIFYFWLYSLAFVAPIDFYLATKVMNLFFHSMTSVVLFVFFRSRSPIWLAPLAAVAWQLGPFAVFGSFLLPESFYSFLVITAIVLTLRDGESEKARWHLLALVGVLLGLAQMVKPHAVFVLVGVALMVLLRLPSRQVAQTWSTVSLIILAFATTRLLVGLGLAGSAGLDLFGGYFNTSEFFLQSGTGSAPNLERALGGDFITLLAFELYSHAALCFFLLFPFIVMIVKWPLRQFPASIQVTIVALVVAVFIAFFEAFVSLGGDDHTNRLLLRHYEFLIPLILMLAICEYVGAPKDLRRTSFASAITAFFFFLAYLGFSLTEGANLLEASRYADSSFAAALRDSRIFWAYVFCNAVVSLWILLAKNASAKFLALATVGTLVGVSVATISIARLENTVPFDSDLAAIEIREKYPAISGDRVLVIGVNKLLTEAAVFQMYKKAVDYSIVGPGSELSIEEQFQKDYDLVVVLGPIKLAHDGQVVFENETAKVIDTR